MAMLCPHCNLPMTDEESRLGACPVCEIPLPGMTPTVVSKPEVLTQTSPYSRTWLIGGSIVLLLLFVGIWFATSGPRNKEDDRKDDTLVADNRKPKDDSAKEDPKPLPEPKLPEPKQPEPVP